jgi:cell division protein FtsB
VSVRSRSRGGQARPPRRRPAPRRNAGSPGAGRIEWDRLGRIALVLAVFVIGALYLGPVWNLAKTYRETSAVKEQYHQTVAENQRLKKLAEHARSESVLRREARRQGMIVIGEQAYVVNGIKN